MSISEAADKAPSDVREAHPAGSWQQAAGLLSAVANMLSSDLSAHGTDRQNRADLIQRLDALESSLRGGSSKGNDSLKAALARLEAELRTWRGMPGKSESPGQPVAVEADGQRSLAAEETAPEANVIGSNQAEPSLAEPVLDCAGTLECAQGGTDSDVNGDGILGRGGSAGAPSADEGKGAGIDIASLHRDGAAGAEAISNPSEAKGLREQFDRLARDVQEAAAQFGSAKAHLPLIEGRETPKRVSETVVLAAPPIDRGHLNVLAKRIEASHRQLAARIERGLAAAANETNTLKDLIAAAAKKAEIAREENQSQRASASLEREIANLAVRLDRTGEGSASLETAIDGLSVQLEETRQIAGSVSHAAPLEVKSSSAYGDETKTILNEIADLRTFHEDIWQRIHLALTGIQQSVEEIARAVKAGAGLHGSGFVPSPSDPFAPILSSLAQHAQDGTLAARAGIAGVSDLGTSNREILLARRPLATDRVHAAGKAQAGLLANDDAKGGEGDDGAASFLIEPGLGFRGRGEESESRAPQGSALPKTSDEREEGASRTDFIAAARRAARTAQKELQRADAKSFLGRDGLSSDGIAEAGFLPSHRGRSFLVPYRRPLVWGGAFLLAAIGTYAMARTLTHDRFSDLMPQILKQFDRAVVRAKSAAAGEALPNNSRTSQTLPRRIAAVTRARQLAATQSPASQAKSGERRQGRLPAAVAASMDPFAPMEFGFSVIGAGRSGYSPRPMHVIAGSNAIMANTFDRNNEASGAAWPRPGAALVPVRALPKTTIQAAPITGASTAQAARAAAESKTLLAEAESGNAAAQYALAVHYAQASVGDRNYALAAQWYGKAAEQGLAVAEYRLASLYEKGLGVRLDMKRAKNLYQRAAQKGNTRAMHNLGVLAAEGTDGKPNYASAASWFGKAAEYGVRDSQYNLAVLLARGLGLPKDLVKSYTWFAIVAAAGDADAATKRDEVAARLTSSELAAANAAVAAFEPRRAERAANDVPPLATYRSANPATRDEQVKPKISDL